jgi:hypothetical protein
VPQYDREDKTELSEKKWIAIIVDVVEKKKLPVEGSLPGTASDAVTSLLEIFDTRAVEMFGFRKQILRLDIADGGTKAD